MNTASEKISERLAAKKQYFQKFYEAHGKTEEDECINKATQLAFDDAKNIVQEVAEEYNGGWIPCSERLPKYGEVVMCSCSNGGITISCITHRGVNKSKVVRFGIHSVVAWQPLPEPFKERY